SFRGRPTDFTQQLFDTRTTRSGCGEMLFSVPPPPKHPAHRANPIIKRESCHRGMDESRKRARTGNDVVVGAPAAKAPPSPESTDAAAAAAATKIAELQVELEALKQSHKVIVYELNVKVDALQAENESRKREIEGLTSALQWAYAVEEIPRQHWLEQGHSEEYADAMENLLGSMKQGIKDLRVGTVRDNKNIVKIDFDLQGENGNHTRADHDGSLLPYWKEFAAALRHWSEYHADGGFLMVQILYMELPKAVLDILRPAFEQSRIEEVFFSNSRHSGDMANFIKKVLQANHFITGVLFANTTFTREDVKSLCGAIKSRNAQSQSIVGLALTDCFEGGIDNRTLKMILASMRKLSLNFNGMSSREAAIIAEFLNSNPCLSQLGLFGNRFNDTDAAVLANALTNNTHLRTINVRRNSEIRENGRLAFLRATFDVSSLSSCAASNHTCRVYGLERVISVINSYGSVSQNKWNKMFAMLALSSEDSFINISLLRSVPAQLIPLVLDKMNIVGRIDDNHKLTDIYLELTNAERCKKHDVWDSLGEKKSLSCMYNLMRSWVVPSIS
ncbi:hypothetical protein THAOC_05765, partial [Thalassiosira oceanica]